MPIKVKNSVHILFKVIMKDQSCSLQGTSAAYFWEESWDFVDTIWSHRREQYCMWRGSQAYRNTVYWLWKKRLQLRIEMWWNKESGGHVWRGLGSHVLFNIYLLSYSLLILTPKQSKVSHLILFRFFTRWPQRF